MRETRPTRLRNRSGRGLRRAGMGTIDVSYALVVLGLLAAPLAWRMHEATQDRVDSVAAGQLARVTEAAEGYVKANLPTLPGQLSGRRYLDIPFDTLKSSGFLSDAWTGVTPYGQTYRIVLTQPDPGRKAYEIVVLTQPQPGAHAGRDAPAIEPTRAPVVAAQAGERGGYVNRDNVLTGAGGGWEIADTRARWGLAAPAGTVGSVTPILEGAVTSTFLNRYDTGDPEANRMHTALDMNDKDITHARTIYAETAIINKTLFAGKVHASHIRSTGDIIATDSLMAHDGHLLGSLHVTKSVFANQLAPRDIVTEGALCTTGNIGRFRDGATASCVNGQWLKLGEGKSCGAYGGVNGRGKVGGAKDGEQHSFNSRNRNQNYYLAQCRDGTWTTLFVGRG